MKAARGSVITLKRGLQALLLKSRSERNLPDVARLVARLACRVRPPEVVRAACVSTWLGCQASKTAFRSHCARPDGSEASCPNFQPRAHAGLTGLTTG